MIAENRVAAHSVESSTLADILERVLDKGIVIAGDVKIKLVDVELLTIQIRLLIASVDKAKEIGLDWWTQNSAFCGRARETEPASDTADLRKRIESLEAALAAKAGSVAENGA